ncbi:DUF4331 domain-containing protein [Kitasatospora aureofaciens]|uniref:DUF4331 domain-containing protein n=1 Tax=Kitasatospora aureofaciens TaxID=1894 RepID=UPI0027E0CD6D|nr:DUF4331 domain-containing protein [Kitasatospora aureofaciens]
MRNPRPSRRRFLAATTALTAAALGGPLLGTSRAGGHFDAPGVALDQPANITDVYAFTSPDAPDTVTVIADVHSAQLPGAAPLNYPWATRARYEIHVDNTGDGVPDLTYRWTFRTEDRRPFGNGPIAVAPVRGLDSPGLLYRQRYTLERIRAGRAPEVLVADGTAAPTHTGLTLMPDYGALRAEATRALPGGGRSVVTQTAESFFIDTRVVGLFVLGTVGPVPGALPGPNPLSAVNVGSIILQVPKRDLALNGDVGRNPVVGVWATVSREGADLSRDLRAQDAVYRQVGRLGNPHVMFALWGSSTANAVPGGPEDRFNARSAADDHLDQAFLDAALNPAPPRRIQAAQGFAAPPGPREDIRALFLGGIGRDNGARFGFDLNTHRLNADADPRAVAWAEQLRLNLATPVSSSPNPDGVLGGDLQGYPNGRRPNDIIDPPLLRMLEGEPWTGRSAAELLPPPLFDWQPERASDVFPYLNLPHAGP